MPVARVQRQVSHAPLPGARKTAAETATSTGAGAELAKAAVGQGLQQLGGTIAAVSNQHMGAIVQQEQERADNVALLKSQNQIDAWRSKRLLDSETGAFTVKGEAAAGLPEAVLGEFDGVAGEIEKGLNPRQRAKFQQVVSSRRIEMDLTLRRHTMNELDRFEQDELTSKVKNSVNAAIANAQDPKMIGAELDRAIGAVKLHGKNLGMGAEAIESKVREITSTTHEGVIEQLLSLDKDKAAKVYFEETRGQINGTSIAKIEKALEEGTLRGESQKRADAIIAKGGTLTEQRAAAREIDDSKLRDQVMTRIEHEANVRDREERETKEATSRQAFDILDRNPDVRRIPPAMWSSFSGSERASLISYAEHKVKGVPVETDLPTYYGLMTKASEDPGAFVTTNLLQYRHQIGETEFKQLTNIQASIREGNRDAAAKGGLGDFLTNKEIVDNTLQQYGITPGGKDQSKEDLERTLQFQRQLALSVAEEADRTKRKPDAAWIQKEADRILSSQVVKAERGWFGGMSYTPRRAIDMTIKDVPADERKRIEAGLQQRGMPVSDQVVLDYFIRARMPRRGGQ